MKNKKRKAASCSAANWIFQRGSSSSNNDDNNNDDNNPRATKFIILGIFAFKARLYGIKNEEHISI